MNVRAVRGVLVLLVVFILISTSRQSSASGIVQTQEHMQETQSYTLHQPIFIDGNEDFTSQGWPGSGTENDPYIIEWLNISVVGEKGIEILRTDVHVIIRNCIIQAAYGGSITGIHLWGAKNIQVEDSDIYVDGYGFVLAYSQNCAVSGNRIKWSVNGIILYNSINCIVQDNTIWELDKTGIQISESDGCIINNNTIYNAFHENGVYCWRSIRIQIEGNRIWNIQNEGILVEDSYDTMIVSNVVHDAGKRISPLSSIGSPSISTLSSDSTQITGNVVYSNSGDGIYISSDNSLIEENLVYENEANGIMISSCENDQAINNWIYDNGAYGIYVTASKNGEVYGNNIGYNSQGQAYDDQWVSPEANSWDDGISRGNAWSDYNGTGTYVIDGPANAMDLYPTQFQYPTSTQITSEPSPFTPFDLGYLSLFITVASIACIIIVGGMIIRFRIKGSTA